MRTRWHGPAGAKASGLQGSSPLHTPGPKSESTPALALHSLQEWRTRPCSGGGAGWREGPSLSACSPWLGAGSSLGGQSWRPRPEVLTSFIAIVVAVAGRLVSWRQPTLDAVFLRVSAEGLWLAGSPVLLSGLLCWLWCVAFCSKVMHMLITRHA